MTIVQLHGAAAGYTHEAFKKTSNHYLIVFAHCEILAGDGYTHTQSTITNINIIIIKVHFDYENIELLFNSFQFQSVMHVSFTMRF